MQVGPLPMPASSDVISSFTAHSNFVYDYVYVDDIRINGLTGASCHDVDDVSVIHNNSKPNRSPADTLTCRICHTAETSACR